MDTIVTKRFSLPTSGSTVDFTDSRISSATVKAVEIHGIAARSGSQPEWNSQHMHAVGFTDGVKEGCIHYLDESTGGSANSHKTSSFGTVAGSAYTLKFPQYGSNVSKGKLSFNSFITNGVRFDVDEAFENSYQITVTFYCGTGVTAKVDSIAELSSAGTITYAGASFAGTLLKIAGARQGANAGDASDAIFSFGWAMRTPTGVLKNYYHQFASADAVSTTEVGSIIMNDTCYRADNAKFAVASFTNSGFTITQTNSGTTSNDAIFLLLRLANTQTNIVPYVFAGGGTGNRDITGAGFQPAYWEALLNLKENYNVAYSSSGSPDALNMTGCFGQAWYDGSSGISFMGMSEDGTTTANTALADSNDFRVTSYDVDYKIVGTHSAFLSDGVRINCSVCFPSYDRTTFLMYGDYTWPTGNWPLLQMKNPLYNTMNEQLR
jgi:hypothetical protein